MFTDIVGYTALMGSDEDKAFKILRKNREIQRPIIKKHRGEWLKEMGDGILASFHTASDAVRCAGEIQQAVKKENIGLRIGIHEGEVVFEGGDVLGDGVNVASRLEELAEEGAINISEAVYKDIKNKAGITATFIEEKILKNVEDPVKVYEVISETEEKQIVGGKEKSINKILYFTLAGIIVVLIAITIWQLQFSDEPSQDVEGTMVQVDKSIAVLPFKNLSEDQSNQHFSDGVMEGILNHLSKINDLRVLSRTSTEKFRETSLLMPQIADELDVTYLLEASVFKSENKIRVTAQLIDATKDEHIWSEQYDRELKDVFEVMSDISQEVASEVKVVIAPEEKELIEKVPTTNQALYDIYLKARDKYNKSSIDEAVLLYQTALEIDSSFALAYTGLAWAYWRKHYWDEYFKEDFLDSVLVLANIALSYDDLLEEAYQVRGRYYQQNGEIPQAIDDFEKALTINPNYVDALRSLGDVYYLNDQVKAISSLHKAASIEKGSDLQSIYWELGKYYRDVGLFEKTRFYYQKAIELYNGSRINLAFAWLEYTQENIERAIEITKELGRIDSTSNTWNFLGFFYFMLDQPTESYKYWSKHYGLLKESGRVQLLWLSFYGYVLWQMGMNEEANNYFNEQIRNSQESINLERPWSRGTARYHLAMTYFFIDEKEKGYKHFEEYFKSGFFRYHMITSTKLNPMLKNIRKEPRFQSLVKKMEEKNQKERDRVIEWMKKEGIALK
jgi:TolB-like protein/Tfp pilus assembly protein PilF